MTQFGLSATELDLISGVLRRHSEVMQAKIFGSRAKGNYRPNSDIDLAVWGNVSRKNLSAIVQELEDLPLPYLFDVEAYELLQHEPLREHIDRWGSLFYSRSTEFAPFVHV